LRFSDRLFFFFSSRRRHTRSYGDWSSDVCSSDLMNSLDQLQAVEGMGPVGEIRLVPDPESFTVLPYVPHSAAFACDMIAGDQEQIGRASCRERVSGGGGEGAGKEERYGWVLVGGT